MRSCLVCSSFSAVGFSPSFKRTKYCHQVLTWLEQVESLGSVEARSTYYTRMSLARCLVPVGMSVVLSSIRHFMEFAGFTRLRVWSLPHSIPRLLQLPKALRDPGQFSQSSL